VRTTTTRGLNDVCGCRKYYPTNDLNIEKRRRTNATNVSEVNKINLVIIRLTKERV